MIVLLSLILGPMGCGEELGEPLQGAGDDDGYRAEVAGPIVGTALEEINSEQAPFGAPYPIVLVHGFSGWADVGEVGYFYGIVADLTAAGADVTAPALPPYDSSIDRAAVLAAVVDSVLLRTHKNKVHLIAHSQGGVDSRVLITDLGYADRVASLTTISTPHRGTAVADLADYAPGQVLNPAGQLMAWLLGALEGDPPDEASWLADDGVEAAYDPDLGAAINGLRPGAMALFNAAHPDPLGVPIFSIAGVSNLVSLDHPACNDGLWAPSSNVDAVDVLFAASGTYLNYTEGGTLFSPTPNDGLVTVSSARWGVWLGCVPADHPDEIGQVADDGPGLISNWDHRTLYLELLAHVRLVEALEN
ncbi:MAG: alpha/beta fold hydrolase [Deltaproteobacteria bacterium]|nr:alpha/beta fold hydrolase [Deltaproteobacteria bacterium]